MLIRSIRLQDSCQVVLFYDWDVSVTDTGEYAEAGSGGVAVGLVLLLLLDSADVME